MTDPSTSDTDHASALIASRNDPTRGPRYDPVSSRPPWRWGRLVRDSGAVIAIRLSGLALLFVLQVYLARTLSNEGFGAYAYTTSLLALFVIPAKLGTDVAAVRYVSEYSTPGRKHVLGAYLRFSLQVVTVTAVAVGLVWLAMMRTGALAVDGLGMGAELLLAVCVPAFALSRFSEGALRGRERFLSAFLPYAVVWPLLILAGLVALGRMGSVTLSDVLAVQAVAFGVVALWQVVAVTQLSSTASRPAVASALRREWLRAAVVLGFGSAFALILGQIDIVIVGSLAGTAQAGRYAAAWRISSLIGGFLVAFNLVLAPRVARHWVERDLPALKSAVSAGLLLVIGATASLSAVTILFRSWVLGVFGAGYTEASSTLVVLCLAQVANAAGGPVVLLLNMTGHERQSAVVLGAAAVVNLGLNLALMKAYGPLGVAVGTAVCTVLWNVALTVVVRRRLGFYPLSWSDSLGRRATGTAR